MRSKSKELADLCSSLATQIARDIFELGGEGPGAQCTRIVFKVGHYPDNERDAGGLCEESLANVVEKSLVRHWR